MDFCLHTNDHGTISISGICYGLYRLIGMNRFMSENTKFPAIPRCAVFIIHIQFDSHEFTRTICIYGAMAVACI